MNLSKSTDHLKFLLMALLLWAVAFPVLAEHPRSIEGGGNDFRKPNSEEMRELSPEERQRLMQQKRRQEREKMIRERREKRFDRLHKEYGLEK